eukprot:6866-Heterococcus_DN1.PRE.2
MLILRSCALQLGRLARASTAVQPQLQQRRILSSSAEERVKERKGPMLLTDATRSSAHPMYGATINEPVYIGKYGSALTTLTRVAICGMPAAVIAGGLQADALFSDEALSFILPVGCAMYCAKLLLNSWTSSYVLSITELAPQPADSTTASFDTSSQLQERRFIAEHPSEWTVWPDTTVFSVNDVVLVQPSMHLLGTFNTCVKDQSSWGRPNKTLKGIHYIHCEDFHDKELLGEILKRSRI